MINDVKTVAETMCALGVSRATVYNLLRKGELHRIPNHVSDGGGRPVTLVSVSSIVNYIKTH